MKFALRHAAALGLATGLAALALAPRAEAFCGFYISGADAKLFNNATQVVLMREGTRTVLSMQNNYEGPPESFAMVVPVPVVLQKENVKTLPKDIFAKVDQLAAPRLVEYWEQDPCNVAMLDRAKGSGAPTLRPVAPSAAAPRESLGVKIEAQFTVGEYEIVILSAKDSGGLDTWLRQQGYKIPAGAEPFLRPYVQAGSKFFVAKIDPKKVSFEGSQAMLSPLRFHYDSESFSLPVRLGLMNAKGAQDLIVHILAKGQRFEAANYPNVTVPTNLDVTESVRQDFGSFYASLFDKTLEKNPKAVVTEYSWSAQTCDPCPGPTLSPSDIATLGGDALPGATPPPATSPKGAPGKKPGPPPTPGRPPPWMSGGGFTITRLHARYTKDSLGEDLVFRAAAPIEGGREFMTRLPDAKPDATPTLEHGSKPAQYGQNQFQGRYAIRHPWTGAVACEHPRRGVWGGPPHDTNVGDTGVKPALKLAFAKREPARLASFLRTDASELGITAAGAPVSPVGGGPAEAIADAGSTAPAPSTAPSNSGSSPAPAKGGCAGCSTGPTGFGEMALGLGALAFLGALARRRAKREGETR